MQRIHEKEIELQNLGQDNQTASAAAATDLLTATESAAQHIAATTDMDCQQK